MELIIIIIAIISIITTYSMMKTNTKQLEKIALNSELNSIARKFPQNTDICNSILKQLGNEKTKIEEDKESETTLYIAVEDKISIGNTHESFTRIQTMAHECLHSIQDKKMLIFNFIYSNIYFMYFAIICILVIMKIIDDVMIYSNIFLILSFIYYVIRVFLENDAMIKAQYIAKEYMEEQKCVSKEEKEKIFNGFEQLNKGLIKGTNCSIFVRIMIKLVIFNALALIF